MTSRQWTVYRLFSPLPPFNIDTPRIPSSLLNRFMLLASSTEWCIYVRVGGIIHWSVDDYLIILSISMWRWLFQPSKATKATKSTKAKPRSFASSVPAKARQRTGDLDDQGWWRLKENEQLMMMMTCPRSAQDLPIATWNVQAEESHRHRAALHQPSPFGDTVTSWGHGARRGPELGVQLGWCLWP